MTFWDWLNRLGPGWPDARGWVGLGVFSLSVLLLTMMFMDATFRADEFVQTIATLVIGTGFVGGAVAWAYSASKTGGELADHNAKIVQNAIDAPTGRPDDPVHTIDERAT